MRNSTIVLLVSILLLTSSCFQKKNTKTVTFKVDMNGVENASNVGIRGEFTKPPWEITVPMEDKNNDGIYEITLSDKTAQNSVEFKFVNQNNQYELEDKNNRVLQFEYKPETITYEADFNKEEGKQSTQ